MVKTKTKTPTLDSVRKVKSGVTELVLQNQKLKKKCRKLKKKVAKLETTSKTSFRNDLAKKRPFYITPCGTLLFPATGAKKLTPYQQNIWKYILWMGTKLDIHDGTLRFSKFINNIPPALMSRHAKSIAAGLLHSSVKPELNKRVMQEKIGVSVPTISQISRIINNS
tara:strand:- start:665 stop:1165 length:501 start_codon:yes stop_codon:yes gene_type:complete